MVMVSSDGNLPPSTCFAAIVFTNTNPNTVTEIKNPDPDHSLRYGFQRYSNGNETTLPRPLL